MHMYLVRKLFDVYVFSLLLVFTQFEKSPTAIQITRKFAKKKISLLSRYYIFFLSFFSFFCFAILDISYHLCRPTFAYQNQDCMQIAVEDRVASKLYVYFDMVADKIHSVLKNQTGKVMIYCRAGMSRSATLCIAYFVKHHSMSLQEAYDFVRERR